MVQRRLRAVRATLVAPVVARHSLRGRGPEHEVEAVQDDAVGCRAFRRPARGLARQADRQVVEAVGADRQSCDGFRIDGDEFRLVIALGLGEKTVFCGLCLIHASSRNAVGRILDSPASSQKMSVLWNFRGNASYVRNVCRMLRPAGAGSAGAARWRGGGVALGSPGLSVQTLSVHTGFRKSRFQLLCRVRDAASTDLFEWDGDMRRACRACRRRMATISECRPKKTEPAFVVRFFHGGACESVRFKPRVTPLRWDRGSFGCSGKGRWSCPIRGASQRRPILALSCLCGRGGRRIRWCRRAPYQGDWT